MNQDMYSTYLKQVGGSIQGLPTGYAPNRPEVASSDADNVQLSVARSRDAVGELVSRVGRLADRLCGDTALINDGAQEAPTPFGVFHEIRAACDQIGAGIANAHSSLDRIEAHLPTTPLR